MVDVPGDAAGLPARIEALEDHLAAVASWAAVECIDPAEMYACSRDFGLIRLLLAHIARASRDATATLNVVDTEMATLGVIANV